MGVRRIRLLGMMAATLSTPGLAAGQAAPPADAELARDFGAVTLPLVRRYCLECHSAATQEGGLDLERFARFDQARAAPRAWRRVADAVAGGEMPPQTARQPDAAERAQLQGWARGFLAAEATRRAGDPGRVVLRRLNNAEYTYTLRDLTGLAALEPAREFPADGAAGEGFTNTGQSLVMSPSLVTKYLDAAKEVAAHAVLLPDGLRFSPGTTPRDWTEATLAEIRRFHAAYADDDGRLPVARYLAATIAERAGLAAGSTSIAAVARERGLHAKYLGILWRALNDPAPSPLLAQLRARWAAAGPDDLAGLAAEVGAWQRELWQFGSVGHIGKAGGPRAWMEPVDPLATTQEIRFAVPPAPDGRDVTLALVATDAGDAAAGVAAIWRQPRLVAPGRPDLPLRDLRRVARELAARRDRLFAATTRHLAAAAAATEPVDVAALARGRDLDPAGLRSWLALLGVRSTDPWGATDHFAGRLTAAGGHAFVNGWGRPELPQLLANSSDQAVRIPGIMKPHGVAVHPSPGRRAVVGWANVAGAATVRVAASIAHAHPECGNGVAWWLELRRGSTRRPLASGVAQGTAAAQAGPIEALALRAGDVVALAIGPRDGDHACDLTGVDLRVAEPGPGGRAWDLAADVADDILAGNPHADRLGHAETWHFGDEPAAAPDRPGAAIPAGSILARWRDAAAPGERDRLAAAVQDLLVAAGPGPIAGPDAALRRQLRSAGGPLLGPILRAIAAEPGGDGPAADPAGGYGIDPARFGEPPGGRPIDPASLVVAAPGVVPCRIPAELADGATLVATGAIGGPPGAEGSVQLDVVAGEPTPGPGPRLRAGGTTVAPAGATWTSTSRRTAHAAPILVHEGSASRRRLEAACDDFRALFPAAVCYARIVPVDEVVTLTQFHREDGPLVRLLLDDDERARLDRLWDELHFVGRDALTQVDAFAQLMEYASQDGDPRVFEPLRGPISDRAADCRRRLVAAEPGHVAALVDLAARAYRRPLVGDEADQVRALYGRLRAEEIPHDEAIRLTLARILVAPAFLYRIERPAPGGTPGPVSGHELATRLSYFLGSSAPDPELRALADAGRLAAPDVLAGQARRLLGGDASRRLAIEFACHWLQIADFDRHDEKSERHFPTFGPLRGAMYEESVRFLADLFRRDGPVLAILDADHTFLNRPLAEHYGIPFGPNDAAADAQGWLRVEGIRGRGRGGILGQATVLAQQSGASRTSPTLRGNWIGEVLLGDRLPRPPRGVAQLPDDEAAADGRTVRQLVERHAGDPKCAGCHVRIDPLGLALEGFDAIGRRRDRDLGGRPVDARARAADGAEFAGLDGLRDYLVNARRAAFVRQFCRKLLGFALGREAELADEALLGEMRAALEADGYRVGVAIDRIVRSRQFREIRGRDAADLD